MPALKGTKTEQNLKEAFAGESQANRRYLYFAQKADVEGFNDVSAVFRSTAEGETGHAHGHLEFLEEVGDPATGEPIGDTSKNLKAAVAGETHEYTDMYPGMARSARDEGFDEIADWFETLAKAEKSHAGRFQKALDGHDHSFRFTVPPGTDDGRSAAAGRGSARPPQAGPHPCDGRSGTSLATRYETMTEGGLGAPVRHPIDWNNPDFYDEQKLDDELRRVFDICHGCRRCFNLCDSFPRLFDLIDESETGELDTVDSKDFKHVVDACTLCDMCFMTKCPYVPPHEFNLDFPHLMLRYRAVEHRNGKETFAEKQLTETDRNGRMAAMAPGLANWASSKGNSLTRPVLQAAGGVDARAELPKFHGKTFTARARADSPEVNAEAPAHGRKAILFATCFVNYNNPGTGEAARAVLARNGVETEVGYPGCCGMPQLEHGDLERVSGNARRTAAYFVPWIDKGYDVLALTPSCALMMKFEWPLIVPEDDPAHDEVVKLAKATRDISEYIVDIADKEGLAEGMDPVAGGVAVHLACHARAQNVGPKAAEMLRRIPETDVSVIERCSGHGGSWGIMKKNFDTALKVGRPTARRALEAETPNLVSECPLAGKHIVQGMHLLDEEKAQANKAHHPIEIMARAYGLEPKED